MVPAPPAVSISTSVSPSPFAPPPTSAPIAGLVSHPLPLPSSSSSSSHVAVKAKLPDDVRVHPDQLAHSSDLDADGHPTGTEHVMERTFPSASRPDAGEATAGRLDAFTHDPLDQPQPRAPSRQVCLSSRTVLLSACVYAYVLCDRVQCCRLWILSTTPRHHAPHGARQRPHCSFLPHLRVSRPLTPCPTLFFQKNLTSYPSIRRRRRRHHHHYRRHRCVDFVGMTHRSSRSTNKGDN